jgi:hypothetical protein
VTAPGHGRAAIVERIENCPNLLRRPHNLYTVMATSSAPLSDGHDLRTMGDGAPGGTSCEVAVCLPAVQRRNDKLKADSSLRIALLCTFGLY